MNNSEVAYKQNTSFSVIVKAEGPDVKFENKHQPNIPPSQAVLPKTYIKCFTHTGSERNYVIYPRQTTELHFLFVLDRFGL